jgi:hypothetical protein
MGYFTWYFADRPRKKIPYDTGISYVACPDGSYIREQGYYGYGIFGGRDVYELVVDWNRDKIPEIYDAMEKRHPGRKFRYKEYALQYSQGIIPTPKEGRWANNGIKREIGIDLACEDEDNAALPYPIKIATTDTIPYAELGISISTQ